MRRKSTSSPLDGSARAALADVVDPVFFHTLGELETIRELHATAERLEIHSAVPTEHYPAARTLEDRIREALGDRGARLALTFEALDDEERSAFGARLKLLEGTPPTTGQPAQGQAQSRPNAFSEPRSRTRVLAISSGKGGVGKSSVTVNLAVALASAGHAVGLLDADVYGFSVPRMLGVAYPPIVAGHTIVPPVAHGVRCISMGFFVDEDKPVAFRGPMLHKALEQFLVDVHWGPLDFLLVDMPPGTGDVALSVAQQLPRAEFYVVTTPQPAAQRVAQRAGTLARQVQRPVRGVIENMSWFETPDGTRYQLFGSGGGAQLADSLKVELLAQLPLVEEVRAGADVGQPAVVADPDGEVARVFEQLAARIVALGPARIYRSELTIS